MTQADTSDVRYTSVTLRSATRNTLKAGLKLLVARQFEFSEQRIMRECLRIALKFWRGRKEIANRNKTYNKRPGPYEIVPFYTTEALRAVAWARCHHSGISLSRLMDFAIANYLPRVLETWLRIKYAGRDPNDCKFWAEKYTFRRHRESFVISYYARTKKNDGVTLNFYEKSEIHPWPPPMRIAS